MNDPRAEIFTNPVAYADQARWHAIADDLRANDPVKRFEVDGYLPFWALTRHADVFEVSRRSDVFHNTQSSVLGPEFQTEMLKMILGDLPKTLVHMDGPEHNAYRHVTNDWFKPAAVKHRQPAIDEIADHFVDRLLEFDGECDFAQDIAVPFTLRVIMSIFGVPETDERMMLELTQGLFGAADPEYMGDFSDPFSAVVGMVQRFDEYFKTISADRRSCPGEDLASVIANGQVDGCPMGDVETLWYYIIVATAGHDTTSYALSGGWDALLSNPDQLRKVQADPSLVTNAAEEMIRWTAPVRHFLRYAQVDVAVGDELIPAGERVLLSYPAANRDDRVFDRPMQFDVDRPNAKELLSFGLGVHYCLGSQFARREIRTLTAKILERVASIELAGDAVHAEANFVGGVKHLPIAFTAK